MKVGLTLGKFAPLHKGHQYLIETALAQVDQLIVLIYECDELPCVTLETRAQWLRDLYPQVAVLVGYNSPQATGYTPEIMRLQENYILQVLNGRNITHFFNSERYGEHVSQALGAIDVRVDMSRSTVPISATKIRQNWALAQEYLHPRVYRDLVHKIVFLGAPSSGKTTLAQALAKRLNTQWMPEYGRTYWEEYQIDRRLAPEELLYIAKTHLVLEDEATLKAQGYLFCDTNAFTTWHFAQYYHGFALPALEQLAQNCWQRYKQVWVCDIDFPYADTWDRSGETNQREFQAFIVQYLNEHHIPYQVVSGGVEERVEQVLGALPSTCLNKGELD